VAQMSPDPKILMQLGLGGAIKPLPFRSLLG